MSAFVSALSILLGGLCLAVSFFLLVMQWLRRRRAY
jgi:hypothetical protein